MPIKHEKGKQMDRRDFFRTSGAVAAATAVGVGTGRVTAAAGRDGQPLSDEYAMVVGEVASVDGSRVQVKTERGSIEALDDGRFSDDWAHLEGDVVSVVDFEGRWRVFPLVEWQERNGVEVALAVNNRSGDERILSSR